MRHLPSILRRPVLNRNSNGLRLLFASMLTHLPMPLRDSRIGRRAGQKLLSRFSVLIAPPNLVSKECRTRCGEN
jgi:hypothetical protein